MSQRGLTRRDLAQVWSSNSRVSEVLSRKRPLTLAMIQRLYKEWGVPAESLIRPTTRSPHRKPVAPQAKELVTAIQADIARIRYIRRLFRDTLTHFGQVDILLNNAAASFNTLTPFVEVTENEFDAVFALNASGAFFAMQEAARVLPDCGRIINISTGATGVGLPGLSAYLGSKAA